MPWTVEELTRWLDAIEPRIDTLDLFGWLELTPTANHADIQPAFHAVARTRHPDLYRNKLPPGELDRLVRVYARITAAYAELRDPTRYAEAVRTLRFGLPRVEATRPPAVGGAPPGPQVARVGTPVQVGRTPTTPVQVARTATPPPQVARTTTPPPQVARTVTPPPQVPRTTTGPQLAGTPAPGAPVDAGPELEPSRAMNPRALAYYRRAEGALRVGDHATAMLQLRMALAADPSSPLLRAAMQELIAQMNRG